jgi:AAA+ superfamily predicted ATPase
MNIFESLEKVIDKKSNTSVSDVPQPRDYQLGVNVGAPVRVSADMTFYEARHRAIIARPAWLRRVVVGSYFIPVALAVWDAMLSSHSSVVLNVFGGVAGGLMIDSAFWIPLKLYTNARARRIMYATATTSKNQTKFARVFDLAFQEAWHLTFGVDDLNFVASNGHVMRGQYRRVRDGSDLHFDAVNYTRDSHGKISGDYVFSKEFVEKNRVAGVRIPAQLASAKTTFADHLINILNDRIKLENLNTWHVQWNGVDGFVFPLMSPTLPNVVRFGNFFDGRYMTYPKILLGAGAGNTGKYVDLHEHAHLLMGGTTGGGKSNQLNVVLVQLLLERFEGRRDIHIWLVDMKRVELSMYRKYVDQVLTDDESAFQVLTFFAEKMKERYEYMEEHGIRNFLDSDMNDEYFLIVDEAAQLFGEFKEPRDLKEKRQAAYDAFSRVMALGRAAGFHIIMATQRPDADSIGLRERELMGWRIAGKLTSTISSSMVLGEQDHAATQLSGKKGEMVFKKIGQLAEPYQAVFLPDDELADILHHFDDKPQPERITFDDDTKEKEMTKDEVFEFFNEKKAPKPPKTSDDSKVKKDDKKDEFGFDGDVKDLVADDTETTKKAKKHIEGFVYENDEIVGRVPAPDPIGKEPLIPAEPKRALRKVRQSDIDARLSEFIGLDKLKTEMQDYARIVEIQKMRENEGLAVSAMSYHSMYLGNPGTGKTTFARVLGDIYVAAGVLKVGHVVEVDRSKLVAGYIGQTAKLTYAKCVEALDGVLFVDEAYTLTGVTGSHDTTGQEALDTIMKFMEDYRDRIAVIFAGYPDETRKLYDMNPGMRSRVGREFIFEDYDDIELVRIFLSLVKKNQYKVDDNVVSAVAVYISSIATPLRGTKEFSNARLVRNIFEEVIRRQSLRLAKMPKKSMDRDALITITQADVPVIKNEEDENNE